MLMKNPVNEIGLEDRSECSLELPRRAALIRWMRGCKPMHGHDVDMNCADVGVRP